MFTGIIRTVGQVDEVQEHGGDCRISFRSGGLGLVSGSIGDSIAVNGVCLTAIGLQEDSFAADVSAETLAMTTLGDLHAGDPVNLEPALSLQTPLGGHLVSGHVDGVGELVSMDSEARSTRMLFDAPADLGRYIARKGSICIDGISLTVNEVDGHRFGVNIVPHTLERTIMNTYRPGSRVNIEVDLVARYLERLLQERD
ncbi:MAG TPA: riboflavin synthase [Chromatiales bacterium]|nr:riboflavin synthase [Chromatiales bacterium]